jgi:hypothetical protein
MHTPLWILLVTLLVRPLGQDPPKPPECRDWQACRQLALDAAARQDYDAFHDLAWRTLQAGPKNDPALMTLVARAQSLSGRPHDALVMLRRLAAMGVTTDAATSNDFERVRALPEWAAVEPALGGKPATPTVAEPAPAAPASPTSPPKPEPPPPPVEKPVKPAPVAPTGRSSKPPAATKTSSVPAPLVFSASGASTVGLGYDAVSGRFLVGDRQERRLLVVGERSGRLSGLAGLDAGFGEVTAFEIDAPEGDLWVVSTSTPSGSSTLHKLQLISGRVLSSIVSPTDGGPARFTDVAVTPEAILILDSGGRRIFRVAKKGRTLELAARLAVADSTSLAPGPDGVVYAAYDRGLLRVELSSRAMTVVEPGPKADLSGLTWIRWHRGSLVAIQALPQQNNRLLRIRLESAGRSVRAVDIIDEGMMVAGSTSATIQGTTLYYLGRSPDKDEVEVKRVTLK